MKRENRLQLNFNTFSMKTLKIDFWVTLKGKNSPQEKCILPIS